MPDLFWQESYTIYVTVQIDCLGYYEDLFSAINYLQ